MRTQKTLLTAWVICLLIGLAMFAPVAVYGQDASYENCGYMLVSPHYERPERPIKP